MSRRAKRVLLLHTGGTLAMSMPAHGAALAPRGAANALDGGSYAQELLARVPELRELCDVESRILCNLDSSDLGPEEWSRLAGEVADARGRGVDGVVVVHGTDTMAYTAAALSFVLAGLDRPVILTGSQRPLSAVRSDARRNLVDAFELATLDIPEVGVCFDGQLLRGCRATKGDAWSYGAFSSPGCAPLARLGVSVEVAPHVRRPGAPFACDARFDPRVVVLWCVPGLGPGMVERLMVSEDAPRGVVLAAFGAGNVPARARALGPVVARAVERGVTVMVATQARAGGVDLDLYENGASLRDAGAIAAGDMGIEAAVTKLMHALARFPEAAARRAYLERDVAGERGM